jgi:hypothetical protein
MFLKAVDTGVRQRTLLILLDSWLIASGRLVQMTSSKLL